MKVHYKGKRGSARTHISFGCLTIIKDAHGSFEQTTLQWAITKTSTVAVETVFRQYADAVVLELVLPEGAEGVALGADSQTATCFPTFDLKGERLPTLNFATQNRIFGNVVTGTGLLGHPNSIEGGLPLVLFDAASLQVANDTGVRINALVVSPLDHFKTALQTVSPPSRSPCDGRWSAGMNGLVRSLPPGFRYRTLMVAGSGIHTTLASWGCFLKIESGKAAAQSRADPSVASLSYYTDNGSKSLSLSLFHWPPSGFCSHFLMRC